MLKIIIFYGSLCCFLLTMAEEAMIGPGKWNLLNIESKKGDYDKFEFDICQRKYNRSHDIFQGSMTFHEDLNEIYGGPGKWNLLNIESKKGDYDKFEFDICQRKYNRSHDIFQGSMTFHEDLNEIYGARVDVCKHVDGGCKQYQVITDNYFGDLIKKYAESNFIDMLRLAGIEDPKFPVKKDKYEFEQYLWNWDGMPEEGPWGRYTADCCVMQGNIQVGCLIVDLAFEKIDGDDDEE